MSAVFRPAHRVNRLPPCHCGWCKRYGNPDVSTGARPTICNGDIFLEIAGRCTRCHYGLGENAYMVRAEVVAQIRYFGNQGFIIHEVKNVPVCEVCVTDAELKRQRYSVACDGCGRNLSFPLRRLSRLASLNGGGHQTRRTCCNACFRRALRKRRRPKRLFCTCCGISFSAARADAKFCSSACRQSTYRYRGTVMTSTEPPA